MFFYAYLALNLRAKIFMLIGDCSAIVWKENVYSEAEERTVRIANSDVKLEYI